MGAVDQRIRALRAAVELAPADPTLRGMLADSFEAAERWDEAIVERRVLAAVDPTDANAKLALARAYLRAGERGPAEIILDELEGAGRMPTEGWRLRGQLLGLPASAGDTAPQPASDGPPDARAADGVDRATGTTGAPAPDVVERPRINFTDVGGMESLKEAIRLKIIYPSQHPEIYAAYGQRTGGGLLLYGPPGCGKTRLARATAGEIGASFMAIGIADVLEMWLGQSERNLRAAFMTARQHTPCVLFFDEIDALAADRADFRGSAGRTVINQFLSELDGVESSNDGLLVLGATNAPWHLDPAFRRPGRFDDVLFVPPPDRDARVEIVRILLRERPIGKVDIGRVAGATDGYSGADLRGLVDRAVQRKLGAALREGAIRPIQTDDLIAAAKEAVPTTREWFATVRNYVMYANQSGLYDPVRPYLK